MDYAGLDILILDTDDSVGFGTVYYKCGKSDDFTLMFEQYQNRIDESYNCSEDIINNLAEGKMYGDECNTFLEGINQILGFWFLPPIEEEQINARDCHSFEEAIRILRANKEAQRYQVFNCIDDSH